MVRQETARLRAILERALRIVSTAAAGGVATCACAGGASHGGAGDAAVDATALDAQRESGGAPVDAPRDADAGSPWAPGCQPTALEEYDASADAPDCEYRTTLPCGLPSFVTSIDPVHCILDLSSCIQICTGPAFPFLECGVSSGFGCDYDAEAFVAPDGAPIVIQCDKCTIAGRRPAGLSRVRSQGRSVLGAFLAGAAHLEAASVVAFERLARELTVLGAPPALVASARRSARDEARHARVTAQMAQRRGAQPPPVRAARARRPSMKALALENAVEGCVRETFGAVVAAWQGIHAHDPEIARAMTRIAVDEIRHAALAWAIAGWSEPLLDDASRSRVLAARRRAVRTLLRYETVPLHPALVERAGLPSPSQAWALIVRLDAELWSNAGSVS